MKIIKSVFAIALIGAVFFYSFSLCAETSVMVPTQSVVPNLNETMRNLAARTDMKVIFPQIIPQPTTQQLYSSFSTYYRNPQFNKHWIIVISPSPECDAKLCTIGSLTADKDQKIEPTYDTDPRTQKTALKEKIYLNNSVTAFYTPGHALADFWPASLEWQLNGVTYTLSWGSLDKNSLKQMAESAIKASDNR